MTSEGSGLGLHQCGSPKFVWSGQDSQFPGPKSEKGHPSYEMRVITTQITLVWNLINYLYATLTDSVDRSNFTSIYTVLILLNGVRSLSHG